VHVNPPIRHALPQYTRHLFLVHFFFSTFFNGRTYLERKGRLRGRRKGRLRRQRCRPRGRTPPRPAVPKVGCVEVSVAEAAALGPFPSTADCRIHFNSSPRSGHSRGCWIAADGPVTASQPSFLLAPPRPHRLQDFRKIRNGGRWRKGR
jgi:hypothetical protein